MISHGLESPNPERIVTRRDFGRELSLARRQAGLTVRRMAERAEVPSSTLGGYLAGRHLPDVQPPDLLARLLAACEITEEPLVEAWRQAYWFAKRVAGEPADTASPDIPALVPEPPAEPAGVGGGPPIPVSTVPPFGRLDERPVRGRRDMLDTLGSAFRVPVDQVRVHVLYGLGGCGKSTVALAAARDAVMSGVHCWWLAAHDAATLAAGMYAIALELDPRAAELRSGSLPDLVWRLLESRAEPWLLILDGVDDPPNILAVPGQSVTEGTGWIRPPSGGAGTVLITTRDFDEGTWGKDPPTWIHPHRIGSLTPEQGAEVILDLTGSDDAEKPAAVALANRLGGFPLALVLAGRYLSKTAELPSSWATPDLPSDCTSYLAALDKGRYAELLAETHATLPLTFELSLDLLHCRGFDEARPLLRVLSCLGPAPVPYEVLLRAEILAASPLFQGITARRVWETLCALDGVSLINLTLSRTPGMETTRLLVLHPVVRELSRKHPDVHRHGEAYLALISGLLAAVVERSDPKRPEDWDRWRLLADHCGAPLGLIDEHRFEPRSAPPAAIDLAGRAAGFLRAAGYLSQADTMYARALDGATRTFQPDDARVLALRHDQARLRYDQGRLSEAERLLRDVVTLRKSVLGDDHPDTLTSQHQLVRVLRDTGEVGAARALLDDTLRKRVRVLGQMHPDTLTSSNGKADLLRARGKLGEACEIYERVLELRTSVLGERHPATLTTRHYLAEVRHRLAEAGAETELRALITINTEVRGIHHPRTLAVVQSLVEVLHDLGRLSEAEDMARRLVEDRTRLLGIAHPVSLVSRHRLGLILLDRGTQPEAQELLSAVLNDRLRSLGPRHPATALSREIVEIVRRRVG